MADPDLASSRKLSTALRRRGHRVLSVRDGSKALEVAVLRAPDLVLYDVGCPLLDARVFAEILSANPRTSDVPVVLMGPDDAADRVRGALRTGYLQKPFNIDEVMSRVGQLLHRVETAEQVRRTGAIEGSLEQLSLPDILQMLAMNRRSGVLRIAPPGREGAGKYEAEILLSEGRVNDARLGDVCGEKALFRVIGWTEGSFTFAPGPSSSTGRISLTMDEALLEGLRQIDELATLEGKAPSRDDVLAVAVDKDHVPDNLHPVTEEVMDLLAFYRTCGEVVDHARATDLDAMRAITTLVDRGFVRVLGRAMADDGGKPLVGSEVAFGLHSQLVASSGSAQARPRVVVAAPEPSQLGRMAAAMAGVAGWKPDSGPKLLDLGFGCLGEVRLTESVRLVLTALPVSDELTPLWRPFGAGAVGAVIMYGRQVESLVDYFVQRGLPVVLVGAGAEEVASGSRGRIGAAPDFVEGLARLVEMVARSRGGRS